MNKENQPRKDSKDIPDIFEGVPGDTRKEKAVRKYYEQYGVRPEVQLEQGRNAVLENLASG